jgi:hypothetical protein
MDFAMSETPPIYRDVASLLRERGSAVLDELISEQAEETLHMEFKTLSESSGDRLVKDDRKTLAKAVCGMANSDGGIIIVGVETRRLDNVDAAIGKRPIKNFGKMRSLLTAAIPEMLSAQHPNIQVYPISDTDDPSVGFVIIEVPQSDSRPHYSNVHHQYFRRGSDGTRVLEHSEIRELMFAVREPTLEIGLNLRTGGSTGDLRFQLDIILTLRNTGRVAAVAPYVRILNPSAEWIWHPDSADMNARRAPNGAFGVYGTRDLLVHVDDDIGMIDFNTGLDFRRTGLPVVRAAIDLVRKNGPDNFVMAPFSQMPPQAGYTTNDRPILISGFYGAENVPARKFQFDVNKMELFSMFCRSLDL